MANKKTALEGITLTVGADLTPLGNALKGVNSTIGNTQKQLKEVESLLKFNPDNTELLADKQKLLSRSVDDTAAKLRVLKEAEAEVQKQFDDGKIKEEQYRAFRNELIKTESQLESAKKKVKSLADETAKAGDKAKKLAEDFKATGEKVEELGNKFKGVSTAAAGVVAGAVAITEATREYRDDMAKLATNSQMAKASLDLTKEAMRELAGVSSETDSNVEAVSNLLQAGFKNKDLLNVIDSLSGAVIKFPDTLKIEGLADGLQETLATGKAIGPFSELLERMGIDLETFNTGLANAQERGKETDFVLQQLAKLGLAQTNQAFREQNKALIENAEAQFDLNDSTAKLGGSLESVVASFKTLLADILTPIVEVLASVDKNVLKLIGGFLLLVAGIAPLLIIVGQTIQAISTISTLFTTLGPIIAGVKAAFAAFSATLLANPITVVILAITGLIAIFMHFWKTSEDFRNFFIDLWEGIGKVFNGFVDGIKEKWDNLGKFINEKIKWLTDKLQFWKKSEKEMDREKINGSHAGGLSYVPKDGYIAELHRGERVLTANENRQYQTQQVSQIDTSRLEYLMEQLLRKDQTIMVNDRELGRTVSDYNDIQNRRFGKLATGRG